MTMTFDKAKGWLLLFALILGPFILPIIIAFGIIYYLYKECKKLIKYLFSQFNISRVARSHKSTTGVEVFSKKETDIHFGRAND